MSTDEQRQDGETTMKSPDPVSEPKKRPRLDLGAVTGKERKRGKSMFGIVLGTLNKAKIEDKERNASEAAKKRQLIEQRLQTKLRKETDSVRRAEEVKKDKTTAGRKEEDLQLKDSIQKLRRRKLPLLANFLITSDIIPSEDSDPQPTTNPLALPTRAHPPPLYYLPAILLPSQEAFLNQRKAKVQAAVEEEWTSFLQERTTGIEEISKLRERVAQEEERKKTERPADEPTEALDGDANMGSAEDKTEEPDSAMQVDSGVAMEGVEAAEEKKDEASILPEDGDIDAVEY